MTIEELKSALVEVKKICVDRQCIDCPFHKKNEYTGFPYCPLCVTDVAFDLHYPCEWEVDDWKEDSNEAR